MNLTEESQESRGVEWETSMPTLGFAADSSDGVYALGENAVTASGSKSVNHKDKSSCVPVGDTPTVKQIKSLTKEVSSLRNELKAKDQLIESLQVKDSVPMAGQNCALSWKDKVSLPEVHSRMKLQYFPPAVEGETVRVSPPKHVETHGAEKWKDCIVGHFVDKILPYLAVRSIAFSIWRKYGLKEVLSNEKGFFFFQFGAEGAYRQISEGLSYIASAIGKPLYADEMTESARRISYAKICVEVSVHSELPHSIDLLTSAGARGSVQPEILMQVPQAKNTPKEPAATIPCANQFSALQGGIIDTEMELSGKGATPAPNVHKSVVTLDASDPLIVSCVALVGKGNTVVSMNPIFNLVDSCDDQGALPAYDFLPHDLGVGISDPDAVFQALTEMAQASSKQAKGAKKPGGGVEIRKFIHANRLSLFEIVESKIRKDNIIISMQHCLPSGWDYIHNCDSGSVAWIIVASRKQGTVVSELFKSEQMILLR
ncbi:hypothetical protein RHSIM_Rhsim10G0103700 [Rhododendron simsii]|uniref:DUF4283 domain-containing protein n=1 Tax=Rhododendron simsii TaxID=118357 RepID=A0A834LD71_RHOSS|nr:hypothetical protein RHSIM_Rhsim10G0103700 [Rhododendron simsii]